MKKYILIVIISLVFLIPILMPLFPEGFPASYDSESHLIRMSVFHEAISDFQIPPRWSTRLAGGFGSPVLMFNWSLPYYLAEPFLFLGLTLTASYKIVLGLGLVLSFLSMYWFIKAWKNSDLAALAGAVFYVYAPYRFTDIYIRGATGEALAFVFWPLLFLAVIKNSKILGSLSFFLLMLSHQVMFLMILPLWIIFALMNNHKSLSHIIWGLLLSAFFWIPAFFQQGNIAISGVVNNEYQNQFIPLQALFSDPLFWTPNLARWLTFYNIGWPQMLVGIVSVIASLSLSKAKQSPTGSPRLRLRRNPRDDTLLILFFFLSIFLITSYSQILWKIIPMISTVVYPVRFLSLAIFTSGILVAFLISKSKNRLPITLLLISINLILNFSSLRPSPTRILMPDAYYYQSTLTSDMSGEFLPKWVKKGFFGQPEKYDFYFPATFSTSGFSYNYNAEKDTAIKLHQFYFPNWKIYDNGKLTTARVSENGEMVINIAGGNHKIRGEFSSTPLETFSSLISILSFIIFIAITLSSRAKSDLAWRSARGGLLHFVRNDTFKPIQIKKIFYRIGKRRNG